MPKNNFRSKSHRRKQYIRQFKKNIRANFNNNEHLKELLDKNDLLYSYLYPNIIKEAIQLDTFDTLRILIQSYLDLEDDSKPLLMLAVESNDLELVELFLEEDFDPNIVPSPEDMSCLMMAVHNNNIPIATLLIENGADVDYTTSNGFNSSMIANRFHYEEMTSILEKAEQLRET